MRGTDSKTQVSDTGLGWIFRTDVPADSLTFQALNTLNVKRRVILTGTPVQVSLSFGPFPIFLILLFIPFSVFP